MSGGTGSPMALNKKKGKGVELEMMTENLKSKQNMKAKESKEKWRGRGRAKGPGPAREKEKGKRRGKGKGKPDNSDDIHLHLDALESTDPSSPYDFESVILTISSKIINTASIKPVREPPVVEKPPPSPPIIGLSVQDPLTGDAGVTQQAMNLLHWLEELAKLCDNTFDVLCPEVRFIHLYHQTYRLTFHH